MNRNAISLFSSSGIGDLGLQANGIKTVIACEIIRERMNLFQNNYPDAMCFCDDIWNVEKYSLQGTTQGNGLTGGVPPVRFSM